MDKIELNSYICSICNKTILPRYNEETNEYTNQINSICGGLGNKVIKDNICHDCLEKMKEFVDINTNLKMN